MKFSIFTGEKISVYCMGKFSYWLLLDFHVLYVIYFQTMTIFNTLAFMLLITYQVMSAVRDERPMDTRSCIHACSYSRFPNNQGRCHQCSTEAKLDETLCRFACGTETIHDTNLHYLHTMCEKCFKDTSNTMLKVCLSCTGRVLSQTNTRLCGECYTKGY